MVETTGALRLVASSSKDRRNAGSWAFLLSNGWWVVWGPYSGASALVVLRLYRAAMNIGSAMKTDSDNGESVDQS